MQVTIKELATEMRLGNNGVTLEIRDGEEQFLGKLRIGRATVEWCPGKTRVGNGHKVSLQQLLATLSQF